MNIDSNWLNNNKNPQGATSSWSCLIGYMKGEGTSRILQLAQKGLRLGQELIGASFPKELTRLEKNIGMGRNVMALPRLPAVTADAIQSLAALREENGVALSRKAAVSVRDTTEAISSYGLAASLLRGVPTFQTVTQTADLMGDSADLHLSVSDYQKAADFEGMSCGEVQKAFAYSKQYYFLRTVKAVTSIASGILGLILLATGVSLLPILALLVISLTTTLFAVARDLHRLAGEYEIISFDRGVKVALH